MVGNLEGSETQAQTESNGAFTKIRTACIFSLIKYSSPRRRYRSLKKQDITGFVATPGTAPPRGPPHSAGRGSAAQAVLYFGPHIEGVVTIRGRPRSILRTRF